jgi:hypothetical protein
MAPRKKSERHKLTITLSFEAHQMLEEMLEAEGGGAASRYIERLIRARHRQESAQHPQAFASDNFEPSTEVVVPRSVDRPRPKHLAPTVGKGG